jgi:hypothetical protein
MWAVGTLDGRFVRKALDTRNLEKATHLVAEMDLAKVERVFLSEAAARFMADCESRKLASETKAKYELMIGEMKACLGTMEVRAIRLMTSRAIRKRGRRRQLPR